VDVVRGRWALSRADGTLAPLTSADALPIWFHLARATPSSLGEVSSSGGQLRTPDGDVILDFPAGAVSSPITVSVAPTTTGQADAFALPGAVFQFTPSPTTFDAPVRLTMRYDPAAIPVGVDVRDLQLGRAVSLPDGSTEWQLADYVVVDPVAHTVFAPINSFSIWGILFPITYLDELIAALYPTGTAQITRVCGTNGIASLLPQQQTLWAGVGTGQTSPLTPTICGSVALNNRVVQWTSSNPPVLALGLSTTTDAQANTVTALAPGTAQLCARLAGRTAASCVTWEGKRRVVAGVVMSPSIVSIPSGTTLALQATARDALGVDLADRTVNWQTSDISVAEVSSTGLVKGNRAGTATISAETGGVRGETRVTVSPGAAALVTLSPTALDVEVGKSAAVLARAFDAAGNDITSPSVTWSSLTPSIVGVSANGVVSGIALGTAVVRAAVGAAQATVPVNVRLTAPALASFTVSPTQVYVVQADATVSLTARVLSPSPLSRVSTTLRLPGTTAVPLTCATMSLVAGSNTDGTWRCTLIVPKGTTSGIWTPEVDLYDASSTRAGTLATSSQLTVNDIAPPAITNVRFTSPEQVYTSTEAAVLTLRWRAVDPAGVDAVNMVGALNLLQGTVTTTGWRSCFAGVSVGVGTAPTLVAGTIYDGEWTCTITIPQGGIKGSVTGSVRASDLAGNRSDYVLSTNAVQINDATPPVISDVHFLSPLQAYTIDAPTTLTVQWHASDAGGVSAALTRAFFYMSSSVTGLPYSPFSQCYAGMPSAQGTAPKLISGTEFDGDWSCTWILGPVIFKGVFTAGVRAADVFSNYSAEVLSTNRFQANDFDAPVVSGVTLGPLSVSATTGTFTLTLTWRAVDPAGVDGTYTAGRFVRIDANGSSSDMGYCNRDTPAPNTRPTLIAGTIFDGVWQCSVTFGATPARFQIRGDVSVSDRVYNGYNPQQIFTLGSVIRVNY
jgi:uncharacterized protein YjdB